MVLKHSLSFIIILLRYDAQAGKAFAKRSVCLDIART
jgi:hypothetical protein